MNRPPKKQHYIWRYYLTPWTSDSTKQGKIACLRINNSKIFSTSLMNVANENYFYRCVRLSETEKKIIYNLTFKNWTGNQKEVGEQWLKLYCEPFDRVDDWVDKKVPFLPVELRDDLRQQIENSQDFKDKVIEHIEKLQGKIEHNANHYILALRRGDLSFWNDETKRDEFSLFIAVQYFRTKKIRDGLIMTMNNCITEARHLFANVDIHPERMWIPLSMIFASNIGIYIEQTFSAVLLQTDGNSLIVGDQPVINTYSTFDKQTSPQDMELYYPITPCSALLLTANPNYRTGQIVKLAPADVESYNHLVYRVANEQVYAKSETHLKCFVQ